MAKQSNVGTRIYLDEFGFSGFLNAVTLSIDQETPDATAFSDVGPRRILGNYDHNSEITGFFDGTKRYIDDVLNDLISGGSAEDHYLFEAWGTDGAGAICYETIVNLSGKPLSGRSAEAVALNAQFTGRNAASRSRILYNATATTTGNQTGQNVGAWGTYGGYQAVFRALNTPAGGYTSLGAKIQHSSDNGITDGYADITGFAGGFYTDGVSRATTTAGVKAYVRAVISTLGGTSGALIVTTGPIAGA